MSDELEEARAKRDHAFQEYLNARDAMKDCERALFRADEEYYAASRKKINDDASRKLFIPPASPASSPSHSADGPAPSAS